MGVVGSRALWVSLVQLGAVTTHNSAYVLRRLGRRLGLLGAAARLVATWPLGPVGLGARHIRAIRYAQLRLV